MARLILRTWTFYWPGHVLLALAVALCMAVVAGALVVGDSVRAVLRQAAERRLGGIDHAWGRGGDKLFRQALVSEVQQALDGRSRAAAVLSLGGTISTGDGARRLGGVRVIGVERSFADLAWSRFPLPANGTVVVSRRLAEGLSLQVGSEVVLRVERPDPLREMALGGGDRAMVACRVRVSAVAGDSEGGGFGLENTHVPPLNAFVDLAFLQRLMEVGPRANWLLVGGEAGLEAAEAALRKTVDLADGGLEWRNLPGGNISELRSDGIFLEDRIMRAAEAAVPGGQGILTYLVNTVRAGDKTTPYAFVAGLAELPGIQPPGQGEVVLTDWLAGDLAVSAGDSVEFRYFALDMSRKLRETNAVFRVRQVVSLEQVADADLMPAIPGMSETGDCADWKTGLPLDLGRVRPKDEAYWDQWRGAPKAFISLEDAHHMWGNRWGSLTAIRYPGSVAEREQIRRRLRERLQADVFRPVLRPVRDEAKRSGEQALDFGQLFLGLSLFLVVASFMMLALLLGIAAEQRMEQTGLFLALGYESKFLWRWAAGKSLVTAGVGVAAGCFGGIAYAGMLLSMFDSGLGGSDPLRVGMLVSARSLLLASAVVVLLVVVTGLAVARRWSRMPVRNLLDGIVDEDTPIRKRRGPAVWLVTAIAGTVLAAGFQWKTARGGHGLDVTSFFVSGACLLLAGLALIRGWIAACGRRSRRPARGLVQLAARNAGRQPRRSLVIAVLTACAVFLLVSVALFEPVDGQEDDRMSGTGGFGLLVQTASPVAVDLESVRERRRLGLAGAAFESVGFAALRVTEGDDAGCGNLSRAQRPRFAGVNPADFARRGAFRFLHAEGAGNPWLLLERDWGPDVVPAVADETTLLWGLQRKVGDEVVYEDESGQPFRVRFVGMLANSVLQGLIVVPDRMVLRHFPAQAGVRRMLVDVPASLRKEVAEILARGLAGYGAEVAPCGERFRQLNAVTILYIRLFQVLGGLGLLLGMAGLAVVVVRNGMERGGELALMRAAGFSRRDIVVLLAAEQAWLSGFGTMAGLVAALVSVWPLMSLPRWEAMGLLIPCLAIVGMLGVALAASTLAAVVVTRGQPWDALRRE